MLIGYIREAAFSVVLHIFGCLKFYRTLIKNNPVLILVESENFLTVKNNMDFDKPNTISSIWH